jgi:hypothetical protein
LFFCVACKKDNAQFTETTSATVPAATASAAAAPATSDNAPHRRLPPGVLPNSPINQRFAAESQNRPKSTVKAEDVFAAFEREAIPLVDKRQHLGSMLRADFCMGAKVEKKLDMSVCEYDSPAAATDGLAMLNAIPAASHDLKINKSTLLILREEESNADNDALAAKARGIFEKL